MRVVFGNMVLACCSACASEGGARQCNLAVHCSTATTTHPRMAVVEQVEHAICEESTRAGGGATRRISWSAPAAARLTCVDSDRLVASGLDTLHDVVRVLGSELLENLGFVVGHWLRAVQDDAPWGFLRRLPVSPAFRRHPRRVASVSCAQRNQSEGERNRTERNTLARFRSNPVCV